MRHRGRRDRIPGFTFALALSLLAAAGPAAAAAAACKPPDYLSTAAGIAECNGGFADPARLAGVFARRLGLAPAVAGRLARAMARSEALQRLPGRGADLPAVREVEAEFLLLLKEAPATPAIPEEATWFYADWGRTLGTPAPGLYDLVAAAPDPAAFALRLADDRISHEPIFLDVVLAGVAASPGRPALWDRAARFAPLDAAKVVFLTEAFRALLAGAPEPRPAYAPAAAALAGARIEAELDAGLPARAAATFRGLPPGVRSWLAAGAHGVIDATAAGLPLRRELHDLRPDLALAFLLAGDREAAAGMVRGLAAAPAGSRPPGLAPLDEGEKDDRPPWSFGDLRRRLAARWLAAPADDPYDLLREGFANDKLSGVRDRLALARLAERESYPAFAAYGLRTASRSLSYRLDGDDRPFGRGMPERLRAEAAALAAEIAERGRSYEAAADAIDRAGPGPDPAAAAIARALAARPPTPPTLPAAFVERPLPAGMAPIEPAPEPGRSRREDAAAGLDPPLTLPPGFTAVRAERRGDRAAAVGVSQDYDPVGEVSPGAYWVIFSADGGRTWSRPLYTGLRVNQPYVVRAASALPLLAGDRLDVEVEVRELDATRIVFPPVALAPKRTAKGLYLEIPLAELERDTDGDGLTDLAEARLLTDPRNPDTDGDGLADGADPLPLVPHAAARTPASDALAALVAKVAGVGQRAIVAGVASGSGECCGAARPPAPGAERTAFFVGDRALFAPLEPDRRVVVLTAEEAAAVERRLGPFFPIRIELFVLDRAGRRGYAVWSASWQGGTFDLEEKDGRWTAKEGEAWIT